MYKDEEDKQSHMKRIVHFVSSIKDNGDEKLKEAKGLCVKLLWMPDGSDMQHQTFWAILKAADAYLPKQYEGWDRFIEYWAHLAGEAKPSSPNNKTKTTKTTKKTKSTKEKGVKTCSH